MLNIRRRHLALPLALACAISEPVLAQSGKSKEKLKKEGERLFTPGKETQRPDGKEGGHWSVVIEGFRGEDQESAAALALEKVRTQGGLPEAYLEKRGPATVVAVGRFAEGESKEAKQMLARVRNTEIVLAAGKTRPFADAFLAPPADIPGNMPEYDLRNARKRQGEWAIYTLQIGVYTRLDKSPDAKELAEFRKMAELAVTTLRREGEQAFYYHGPTKSMVTVGLFGQEDFDPQTPAAQSAALMALRKRYPHNLYNGQGIKQTVKVNNQQGKQVTTTRMQPSSLVEVPKSEASGERTEIPGRAAGSR